MANSGRVQLKGKAQQPAFTKGRKSVQRNKSNSNKNAVGPLSGQNLPIIIGGVLLGAVVLLFMRSRGSQQVVSTAPALTLYPSTQADISSVANLKASVDAIAARRQSATSTTPTGGNGGTNVSNPNPTTPSSNSSLLDWLRANGWPFTHNIPVGGSGNGGLGGSGNSSGSSNPMDNPAGSSNLPTTLSGLPLHDWSPAAQAYRYAGNLPGTFDPSPINQFQTANDLGRANPNNAQDVGYIAGNYYAGNQSQARQGIVNAQIYQSGDWSQPLVQAQQAVVNPVGAYLQAHPGASITEANRAVGAIV